MARTKDLISFPLLNDCGGDLSKGWYVQYLYYLPLSGDRIRKRLFSGLNVGTERERRKLAKKIIAEKTEWLKSVKGRIVTGTNGNSIFLPLAGYRSNSDFMNEAGDYGRYWSSSLRTDDPFYAWLVNFGSVGLGRGNNYRYQGLSVRPVL